MDFQVVIIGGGLAGLLNGILLARQGIKVALIEKKQYPFHKVCGEYISNEVAPFLQKQGLYPEHLGPAQINQLVLSGPGGKRSKLPLDMGGFGISRYELDNFWYQQAQDAGVLFFTGVAAEEINFIQDSFSIQLSNSVSLRSQLAIGAYGKRTSLDKKLARPFIESRSPYVGVKYHAHLSWPNQEIALHNFKGGYCGISTVENNRINICYLTRRENIKQHGSVPAMEQQVVKKNPHLRQIFDKADMLFEQPLVINEVSFAPKSPVERHILMSGDAAGLITPLCGNGMAMAIKSAYLLSNAVLTYFEGTWSRETLEKQYSALWQRNFAYRLWVGRKLQSLFEGSFAMNSLVTIARQPWLAGLIVQQTHGRRFGA